MFACVRQPSQGPTFGIKGGAAGGGYSQVRSKYRLRYQGRRRRRQILPGTVMVTPSVSRAAPQEADTPRYGQSTALGIKGGDAGGGYSQVRPCSTFHFSMYSSMYSRAIAIPLHLRYGMFLTPSYHHSLTVTITLTHSSWFIP